MGQASIAIVGAGPAGLFAAEELAKAGHSVTIFDAMPSPGRKFLLAGRGGLNLTHSEAEAAFLGRYGASGPMLAPALSAFPPGDLRAWADGLGEDTFTGTSGRVFPKSFKATPLLRAWLRRLDSAGVTFRFRHRWTGWTDDSALTFDTPTGEVIHTADAALLALGGASWPRLGSDGAWVPLLRTIGVEVTPLAASNVGVSVPWSSRLTEKFDGAPLKGFAFSAGALTSRAEAVITSTGLEGGAIYALSGPIREALATGNATLTLDLRPDVSAETLATRLSTPKKGDSLANTLRKQGGLSPVAIALLREASGKDLPRDPAALAASIKAVALPISGIQSLDKAISTAGGIARDEVDASFMLTRRPGVFVAGEMLDWDAPTGGYLLQACFSTAHAAAAGITAYLKRR